MRTNVPASLQIYDHRGMPTPPPWDRSREVDLVVSAFAAAGTLLDRDFVDLHLLEIVDKAACSLLRDQWTDGFPVAAYTELLTTIAALRSVLGYSATPTAVEVNTWARNLRNASAEASGNDKDFHEVRIVEGPHMGVLLGVWGPKAPQEPDTLAGPILMLELPTEVGDSKNMEFGTAYYRRLKRPQPNTGQWEYMLDRTRSFPVAGSRPHFRPIAAQSVCDGAEDHG
ncbi:hypothetical protein [Streptomyces sp. SP18BB07]|uniref:hypothetical protein n=1 Tax=Streptomyces sp. SP18BB07 TaxID=3002522 RepID=UPI002E7A513C|nr:hypothetical protein [Streptomyces sp. SP18BB07]MEE1764376.1 hypothetical protein [Streptomyces sp. SP18BB07]